MWFNEMKIGGLEPGAVHQSVIVIGIVKMYL
jgi:hypothetical protein